MMKVPKTAKINVASLRMFGIVGGTRLSARIARVMMDKARSVRTNRYGYAAPCDDGSEVMDTMTDGIDSTRVAIRKPCVRFSNLAIEALRCKSAHAGSLVRSTYRSAR